jgi:digeranylgeranylglycerophospholipid reductase
LKKFFDPDSAWISTEVSGLNLVAPNGIRVHIDTIPEKGYILDRSKFDLMIAEKAVQTGATLLTGMEAYGMKKFDKGRRVVLLRSKNGEKLEADARVVIAADGVDSRVGKWAGLSTKTTPRHMESCSQVILDQININHHEFDLYFTNEFAPGGYAWMFPKGEGKANVGLGISGLYGKHKTAEQYLDCFVSKHFPEGKVISRTRGGVSCSGGVEKLIADGLIVCGDAAHLADPITGGGLYYALVSGKEAAMCACEAIKKGGTGENSLELYKLNCNRIIKKNRNALLLKRTIVKLTDAELNQIASKVIRIPKEKCTPKRVLFAALWKHPSLIPVILRAAF